VHRPPVCWLSSRAIIWRLSGWLTCVFFTHNAEVITIHMSDVPVPACAPQSIINVRSSASSTVSALFRIECDLRPMVLLRCCHRRTSRNCTTAAIYSYEIKLLINWKNTKMSQCQRSRSKCQKLRITSSVIVTDIPIKPHQFPTSSFWVARYRFFAAATLTLKLNLDLDILKMYLETENKFAR